LEAIITLEYAEAKTAEAVSNAVSPDNFKTPIDLKVKTIREEKKVLTFIQCQSKLVTFIATIDDLLFSVSTAEKTLQTISKLK